MPVTVGKPLPHRRRHTGFSTRVLDMSRPGVSRVTVCDSRRCLARFRDARWHTVQRTDMSMSAHTAPDGSAKLVGMPQTVAIGSWARLDVYGSDETPPPALSATDYLWRSSSQRRAVLLYLVRSDASLPYVAVWPPDKEPRAVLANETDLGGVVLTEPSLALHCFACGTDFAGLYPDLGLPFFGTHISQHRLTTECPVCGAASDRSRLSEFDLFRQT